jgi:histone arginine demethylase JMJD6
MKEDKLKIGEDDDGVNLKIKMKHFLEYLMINQDDSPLYLFEGKLDRSAPGLLNDYEVSVYFKDDLFKLVGHKRPPYRWFLIGPERSGSKVH